MGTPLTPNKAAYEKALKKDWKGMVEYYENHGVDVLLPISVAKDCALHVAVQSKRKYPLNRLLEIAKYGFPDLGDPERNNAHPVLEGNVYGNTALHLAATFGNYEAVTLLMNGYPALLVNTNIYGETPLFTAASFGETNVVKYLATKCPGQIVGGKLSEAHRVRSDGISILHIAVQGEHFDTALLLLELDESLAELEDKNHQTSLHLLANMPSAFRSGYSMGIFKKPIYACLPVEDSTQVSIANQRDNLKDFFVLKIQGWPIVKKVWDDKRNHALALELAKLLIERDNSCLVLLKVSKSSTGTTPTLSYVSTTPETKVSSTNSSEKGGSNSDGTYNPTPLFIAAENGITEIVETTLALNPQGIEHIDVNGRNILHLAIMHRREKIFNLVKEKSMEIARLNLGVDKNGYTLLHHAADTEQYIGGSKPGPALQLQEELQWFARVQEIIPPHFALHRANKGNITAWELFKKNHEKQLKNAQQWVKDTSQSCSTVAVLVATVVFAAAYTVPGGYEENKGTPIFLHSPYFLFFTIMDVISLAASLTSVVMFLSVLTSPFEIENFRHSLPRKLMLGFTLLFFSVVTTMLTFGATILLTVHLEQKLTTSLLSIAAFFPVLVFAFMQFRLYIAFIGIFRELVKDIVKALPSCPLRSLYCKDKSD